MTEHKSPWRVRMEARKIKLLALVDRPFPAIVEDAGGYYCNAKRADAVISRLEKQLAESREREAAFFEANEGLGESARAAHAELAAEKALADRLHFALTNHENADINAVFAAYRKARGL